MACKLEFDEDAFNRLGKVLSQSKNRYDLIGSEIVDTNSEIYLKELKKEIEEQIPDWTPLNEAYKARKGLLGLDTRILIATGEYLENIQVRELNLGGGTLQKHVGVDNTLHSNSKLTMSELATMLEFGTSKMPARPLFSDAWKRVLPQIRNNTLEKARSIWRGIR